MADNLPPSCAVVTKSGTLTSWNPLGHSRPVMGLIYIFYMVEWKPLNEVCRKGKKVLERPSRKWENKIMKVLREICREDQWFALVNRQIWFFVQCGDFF